MTAPRGARLPAGWRIEYDREEPQYLVYGPHGLYGFAATRQLAVQMVAERAAFEQRRVA